MMNAHKTRSAQYSPHRRQSQHHPLFSDIHLSPPKEIHYEVKYTPPREEEVARVETLPTEHMPADMGEKRKKTSCCSLI